MSISVIVPCYNAQEYVRECLDSLAAQSWTDFEVIAIDDGSADDTAAVLEAYAEQRPELSLRLISQPNAGVSAARNAGLDLATGDYVTFVDADDTVEPEYLRTLHDALEGVGAGTDARQERAPDTEAADPASASDPRAASSSADPVGLSVVGIGGDGYGRQSGDFEGLIEREDFIHELWLTDHLWGSTCNKLFHRSIIEEHGIGFDPELRIMEDMFFVMRYCEHIDRMRVVKDHLYIYRSRSDSAMHRGFVPANMSVIDTFQRMLALPLNNRDREIIELHQVNGLMWIVRTLYQTGTPDQIATYEPTLRAEIARSRRGLFLRQGWRKGPKRYVAFLLYSIHPALLKTLLGAGRR